MIECRAAYRILELELLYIYLYYGNNHKYMLSVLTELYSKKRWILLYVNYTLIFKKGKNLRNKYFYVNSGCTTWNIPFIYEVIKTRSAWETRKI